jgi:DNA-binding IclR family transcriptional regulator
MTRKDKNDYLIQSVSLTCSLLEQFRGGEQDLSVTELSKMLRVGKNNVLRLLATLEMRNFVERNPASGSYRLGVTSLKLSTACIRSRRFMQEARLPLEEVARQSNETAILAVFGEGGLVCEDAVESTLPVRVRAEIGTNLPLHSTASGRIMLAFGNIDELQPFLTSEPAATSMNALSRDLNIVRGKGYAISFEEFKPDVSSIAAPVRDHLSRVIGVISVVGPSYRIPFERLQGEMAPLVVRCARDISARLGHRSPENKDVSLQAKRHYFNLSAWSGGDNCAE